MTPLERLQKAQEGLTSVFSNPDVRPHIAALEYAVSALLQWAVEREQRDEVPTLIPPDPKAWERRDPFSEEAIRAAMPTLPEVPR